VSDVRMEEMWKTKIPLKVRNFIWLIYHNRVQIVDNLIKKQWKRDKNYKFCNEETMVSGLPALWMPVVILMWSVMRDGLKWKQTTKSEEF
jgi:hypothetical protein